MTALSMAARQYRDSLARAASSKQALNEEATGDRLTFIRGIGAGNQMKQTALV